MPRQATRSAARGPLDKLRGPVRKMAEEVFSVDTDRAVLKDEPLLNGLSELQTKQAIKVLETYCANVQRQGSGRIQNKAAYLMSLIQSYKLGPSSGNPGSAQRLVERLSPAVRRAVEGVFDPVVDRVVLEDRALMELLAKVPEEQALAALKKYRATVQRRGRDAIDNRCGYLIGFLKQYQDGVAVVGPSGSGQPSRGGSFASSNGDGPSPANSSTHQSSSASNGHHPMANGTRTGGANGSGGPSPATVPSSGTQAGGNGGGGSGIRPISYLQPPVRKQLEKLFESGKDKAVLEDVGLIKQLARLGEEQALAALKNYKEASKHRRDIHNKSAYLMGILRGYIEGTTPITKAPWEGRANDEGSDAATSSSSVPQPSSGASGNRARGRGRGSGTTVDDAELSTANSMPRAQVVPPQHPQVQQPQMQPPQLPQPQPHLAQPQMPQAQLAQQDQLPAPSVAPPLSIPGPLGGFTTPTAQPQQPVSPHEALHVPLTAISSTPSTSPLNSPLLGGGGLFISGIGHNGSGADTSRRYEPSSSLMYLDRGGGGGMSSFGSQANPPDHDKPPRHCSQHESLFGNPLSGDQVGQQHPLVGPGLLGGEFLVNGGGSDRGVGLTGSLSHVTSHAHANATHSNHGLFGSGLLAGNQFEISNGGLGSNAPASPGSRSAQGSTSGLGSSSLSAAGSGEESPLGSDSGNDVQTVISTATGTSTGLSGAGASIYNDSTDYPSGISPRSGEGTENTSNSNEEGGMADMLARLNLSKYVPVLAEAEVDMDALRLFGEDDLKDLGFPKGPRIKLLHEVQNLNFTPMA